MTSTQELLSKDSLHQGAVTYMTVTGSVGGKYAVEMDGFAFSAEVHRSAAATCSFCAQEGHDVGPLRAPKVGVLYEGNEWENA